MEKSDLPIKNIFTGGDRLGARHQHKSNIITNIPFVPMEGGVQVGVTKDPSGDGFVTVGSYGNSGGQCWYFDIYKGQWETGKYNNISDDISNFATDERLYSNPHAVTIGQYIVVAGGEFYNTSRTNSTSNIVYILDTETNTWSKLSQTMPNRAHSMGHFKYNGKAWFMGGYDGSNYHNHIFTVDPTAASGEELTVLNDTLPYNMGESGHLPVVDGEVYIWGIWNNYDGTTASSNEVFFKYDLENGGFTELAPNTVMEYSDGSGGDAFGQGTMHEHNGNLFYIDGYWWLQGKDVAYYSIENDEWIGTGKGKVDYSDDNRPDAGAKNGVVFDGVMYCPGTGSWSDNLYVHVLRDEPFKELA